MTEVQPGWAWAQPPVLGTAGDRLHPRQRILRRRPGHHAGRAGRPAPSTPGDVLNGFLALTPADFHLVGVDLDGALLKALALADSLANANDPALSDGLLAALRSSGISLLADNRGQQVLQAIQNNQALNGRRCPGSRRRRSPPAISPGATGSTSTPTSPGPGTPCTAATLPTAWAAAASVINTDDEEGFTQLAVVQPADDPNRPVDTVAEAAGIPQPGTDLYVNERIARWNGWSLSAPRPGTPLNRSPDPAHALDADPDHGPAGDDLQHDLLVRRAPRFPAGVAVRCAVPGAGTSRRPGRPERPARPKRPRTPWSPLPAASCCPTSATSPSRIRFSCLRSPPTAGGSLAAAGDPQLQQRPVAGRRPDRRGWTSASSRHREPRCSWSSTTACSTTPSGHLRGDAATYQLIVAA